MKFIQYFVLSASLAFLSAACKKDQEPAKIALDSNKVRLWAGRDTTISILAADGQYTVSSDNAAIAGAAVQGNKVLITAHQPGNTVIRIADAAGRKGEIKLEARSIDGAWRAVPDNEQLKSRMVVEAADPVFANTLQTQLQQDLAPQLSPLYMLQFNLSSKQGFAEGDKHQVLREGTFTFSNFTLTLTHNGAEEVYRVLPQSVWLIVLERDLTEHYKALHPDKGIRKVVLMIYLKEYVML